MIKMKFYCCSILFALLLTASKAEEHNCSTLTDLFYHIYHTDDNLYRLNKVFYPSRAEPPTYVHVTYLFKAPDDDTSPADEFECKVHYIWAEGGFLLIQPPSIFQLTSLLFNQEKGEEDHISLKLPPSCKDLVQNSSSGDNCTCTGDWPEIKILDILTQQLKLLAKFNDETKLVRDTTAHAYAVCDKNLEDIYYAIGHLHSETATGVIIFFTILFLLPLISLTLTTAIVRSLHQGIHVRVIRSSNHKTVAGLVLMGMFVTFFITGCDAVAVHFYIHGSEVEDDLGPQPLHYKSKVSFFCTLILLGCDIYACFHVLSVLLYVCCKNINENASQKDECCCCCDRNVKTCCKCITNCCITHTLGQCCFYTAFFAIFGTLQQNKVWKPADNEGNEDDHDNEDKEDKEGNRIINFRTVWVIVLALAGPAITINTHIGFILVSWLTDEKQASSVVLIYLAALTYLFFMFRQCYIASAEIKPKRYCWSIFLPLYPFRQCFKYFGAYFYTCCCWNLTSDCIRDKYNLVVRELKCAQCCCCYCNKVDRHRPLEDLIAVKTQHKDEDEEFNTKAFCIVFSWGWFLVLPIGLILFALSKLPIKTIDLPSHLLNTFQIFILLVSLLITYKIISLSETDVSRFLRKMRKAYIALTAPENGAPPLNVTDEIKKYKEVDDVEAAACLVGELAEVVVHKLPRPVPAAGGTQ